jgi:hypothetical protein
MLVLQKAERLMSLLSLFDFWFFFFRKSKCVISVASLQFSRFELVPGSSLNHKVCCKRSCRNRLVSLIETWVKLKLLDTVMNCWIVILLTWHLSYVTRAVVILMCLLECANSYHIQFIAYWDKSWESEATQISWFAHSACLQFAFWLLFYLFLFSVFM